MKNFSFLGFLFLSSISIGQIQETTTPIKRAPITQLPVAEEPKPQISVKSSSGTTTISKRAGEEQRVHNEEYYNEQLIQLDNHISAIDEKINFVNNNEEEKKIAEESNWFENMAKIRSELVQKRLEIQDKLSNSKN